MRHYKRNSRKACEFRRGLFTKKRFDDELISLLLQWKWWDLEGDALFESLSILVNPDLGNVRLQIKALLAN